MSTVNAKPPIREIVTAEVTTRRFVVPRAEDRRFLAQAGIAFATLPTEAFDDINATLKSHRMRLRKPVPWDMTRKRISDLILSRYPATTFGPRQIVLRSSVLTELDDQIDTVRRYLSAFALRCEVARDEQVIAKATGRVVRAGRNSLLATGAAKRVHLAQLQYSFDAEQQTASETVQAIHEVRLRAGGHQVIFAMLPPLDGIKDDVLQVRMAPILTVGEGIYENNATACADTILTADKRRDIVAFAQELLKRFA